MAFGQDFLNNFFGNEYLRDYSHASQVFRTNGYANAPRFKFLFHVYFRVNLAIPALATIYDNNESATLGVLVKTVDLPRFGVDVDVMNQYNRKRLIQNRINYEPVRFTFHDDGRDTIRRMWFNYYSYYYKDPNQPYNQPSTNGSLGPTNNLSNGFAYNNRDIYAASRLENDWGYIGENYNDGTTTRDTSDGKPPFFRDISIFGFNQHEWVSYVLINPLITEWNHDTYDYSQNDGVMENAMTLRYETVKYYTGAIGRVRPDTNVPAFADPARYDTRRSPLSRPGGTASVLGQGGILDTGIGIIEDLSTGGVAGVVGSIQKAGSVYNTFKGRDLRATVNEEANQALRDRVRADLPGAARGALGTTRPGPTGQPQRGTLDNFFFPTPPRR